MTIEVHAVDDQSTTDQFFAAQGAVLARLPNWRPPPVKWEQNLFAAKNPLLQHLTLQRWVAVRDGIVVGRIAQTVSCSGSSTPRR